jgi:hypothetical protein
MARLNIGNDMIKKCKICDKEFYLRPSRINRKYCSLACCYGDENRLIFTQEHKDKIRKAITGIKRSLETKLKMSTSKKGKTHK